MSKGTKARVVRIEDGLWEAAREVAQGCGDNLSDIMRHSLERYTANGRDPLTEILELSENATTVHARLSLRDQIQAIAERLRSQA
jgi:hypothetical protein